GLAERFGGAEEIGVGADRVDAGDADAEWTQFNAQRVGEAKLGEFGCRVSAEVRQAPTAGGGRDDHDLAAPAISLFLLPQIGDGGSDAIGRAEYVGLENSPHLLGRSIGDRANDAVTSVADKRVDPAEMFDGSRDEVFAIGYDRDVRFYDEVSAAEGLI